MKKEVKIENAITEGVIWKQLLLFFYPILFGTFFQQLYNTIDAVIIGKYVGKQALAAISGSSSVIINLLVGFFVGLSSGATVIISQFYGAKDDEQVQKGVHTAIALSLLIGILFMILGITYSPFLLHLTNTPQDTMEYSVIYMRIYFIGMIPSVIYNMSSGIMRAIGDSKRPLYFLMISCLFNIVFDLLFVAVFKMEVVGAALATIMSQVLSAVLATHRLLHVRASYQLRIKQIRFHTRTLEKIMLIGLPAGIQSIMYSISNIIIQSSINAFGTETVAAWGVYGKVDGLFWMTMSAFGVAITTFVGQNYGAGKIERIKKSTRICLLMSAGVTITLSVVFYIFAGSVFLIFTNDPDVIRIGIHMMRLLAPTYITYVAIEILSGSIRGTGDSFIPTVITFMGICVLRILWIVFVTPTHHTISMVTLSYPITWSVTSVAFILYYIRFLNKLKTV